MVYEPYVRGVFSQARQHTQRTRELVIEVALAVLVLQNALNGQRHARFVLETVTAGVARLLKCSYCRCFYLHSQALIARQEPLRTEKGRELEVPAADCDVE